MTLAQTALQQTSNTEPVHIRLGAAHLNRSSDRELRRSRQLAAANAEINGANVTPSESGTIRSPLKVHNKAVREQRRSTEKFKSPASQELVAKQAARLMMERCRDEHPVISLEKGIFGGVPHIKEMRLSVGDVLAQLYLKGSVRAVAECYSASEEEIKEAIAFAQDFLEMACEPYQANG